MISGTSKEYVRTRLPDNSFKTETYIFGEGGRWDGAINDKTIDHLSFLNVAELIAGPLQHANYVQSKDANHTDLLIVVYWGMTSGTEDTRSSAAYQNVQNLVQDEAFSLMGKDAMEKNLAKADADVAFLALAAENHRRDRTNLRNARILGFRDALDNSDAFQFTNFSRDLLNDLEANRYFVVLKAYDFNTAWKQKKKKLLWETRFSVREHGHAFGEALPAMALHASQYFGQNSGGLIRKPLPEVKVKMGETEVIGFEPAK